MAELQFKSSPEVDLVEYMGDDASIVSAARVSVVGEDAGNEDAAEHAGLIQYLMAYRHGCYDSQTEVLTSEGWKLWPQVDGSEFFLTLNLATDEIEYQRAERVVHKEVDGPMIRLSMAQVDALVTPDHRMVAAPRTHEGWTYDLLPARDLLERSHRLRLGAGSGTETYMRLRRLS